MRRNTLPLPLNGHARHRALTHPHVMQTKDLGEIALDLRCRVVFLDTTALQPRWLAAAKLLHITGFIFQVRNSIFK